MSNPTTPFSWQMPTATDLVTDLPADFEVFGQAVATSMADLLGGTTGQVLAKNSNTDMDFVWTTANPGDITGVTAGTGISGGGTSGTVTITNSMATEIAAKGDLIVGTGSATFDNLTAGSNGETLVADSSTSTGLRYQGNYAAGKNEIINGAFDVWQRGTSFSNPANGDYTTDRFKISFDGTGATRTVSRQTFTPGTAPVAGYEGQYFYRVAQTVAGTSQTFLTPIIQRIENVQTLAGQTATLSFWAKAGASISISGGLVQNFGSGGSGSVNTSVGTHNLTTSWQRFTATVSIPSISGKTIGTSAFLELYFDSGSPTAVQTLDFWGFQLEASNTATAFQTATGTLQGELAACQRYYWRMGGEQVYQYLANGCAVSSTETRFVVPNPVTMRTTPTSLDYSTLAVYDVGGATFYAATSVSIASSSRSVSGVTLVVASGLTTQRPFIAITNNSLNGFLGFIAEL